MMSRVLFERLAAALVLFAGAAATASAETKLLRYPDVHDEEVVFCYAGDLWTASLDGGTARRLTAHPGRELFPKYSPDGRWIAFTGQYDGDEQVYVMPALGGAPRQLTYYPSVGPLPPRHGVDNQVCGWTVDGKRVLFRSMRDADGVGVESALYTVDRKGGLPAKLPMPTAGAGDFSPNGTKVVYSPLFRDFRTWKRYEGGWAQYLMIFDLESYDARKIAVSKRTERDPMWIGHSIYFVSDRDGTLNLFKYDMANDKVDKLTDHNTWDVRWASSDNRQRVVYELGGSLYIYDTKRGAEKKLSIDVPHDGLAMRPSRYDVADDIEDFELSPHGRRALFVARGDIFTVPSEKGPTRNLTRSSGAHDKWARWSPDGRKIAYISDASGEDQLYLVDQDGLSEPEQITDQFRAMLYAPAWSPDGERIAMADKDGKLYVVDIEDKEVVEVAEDKHNIWLDYAWSPCGGHLAFTLTDTNGFSSLYIWTAQDGAVHRVTEGYGNEHSPAWDPAGKYLYFLARREFAPQISTVEWNYAGNRNTCVFALALREDVADPFAPESDEVSIDEEAEDETPTASTDASESSSDADTEEPGDEEPQDETTEKDDEAADDEEEACQCDDKDEEESPDYTVIDFDGLAARVARVPLMAENYGSLWAVDGKLLYVQRGASFYGRESYEKPSLRALDIADRDETVLASNIGGFAVSADGEKVLVRQGGSFKLFAISAGLKGAKPVSTSDLAVDRVPTEEWNEIFDEVWRRFRDFFYVPNMHGYDWDAIGDRYRALLPHVAHRDDLNYLLSEMVSELNVGHAYIQGGDFTIPERPKVGLPGATFELDKKAGRYRIAKIYTGQNQETKYRAPLSAIGVDIREGDFVLAIDGTKLEADDNPYRLLQHKTDPVTLTVSEKAKGCDTRDVTYSPIFSEQKLRYLEWVRTKLEYVTEKTDGRVGYIHIPDMGADGAYEFTKWFYPQVRKEGLVIDDRSNGGGNISQWIIERLGRKLLGTRFCRLLDGPETYPDAVFHGHMVCLINEVSASDGDIFPYYFREAGLGPLIGKRTWGGVVGITDFGPLIDGGTVYVPFSATNSKTGEYIIEGYGVDPDIEVENMPKDVIEGRDPQLDRAIEEVLKRIEADPRVLPSCPAPAPVKVK